MCKKPRGYLASLVGQPGILGPYLMGKTGESCNPDTTVPMQPTKVTRVLSYTKPSLNRCV